MKSPTGPGTPGALGASLAPVRASGDGRGSGLRSVTRAAGLWRNDEEYPEERLAELQRPVHRKTRQVHRPQHGKRVQHPKLVAVTRVRRMRFSFAGSASGVHWEIKSARPIAVVLMKS